ncbi:MAG: outer membrane protein OmpK [Pseudomonas sp.]|uniref:outer membrane protein OmpK n=1 Tax=Pseudomonas sp. TaxID=306 RepID=UPI0027359242|nr:outer membrane protein OmpK [Pseudomonas sp.]MDP3846632.1 outer membrane protein OmpK [Pseudomonas sp.]
MQRTFPSLMLATGLALSGHAMAGDLLKFQDNSLTYLNGDNFNEMNFNDEEQRSQSTFSFEHASGWGWGDVFMFIDYVNADNMQYSGNHLFSMDAKEKSNFYYMEINPRVSGSWLTGQSLAFGPVKDVLAAFVYEKGNGGPGTENYLYGMGLDWDAPGFAFLQTNLYRVKINNNVFFDYDFLGSETAGDAGNGYAEQLTIAGAYPFAIGEQSFVIDGYADWRSASKEANTQTSLGSSIQVKWDAGKELFGEARKLYVGTELNMWHNKYGIKPIDGSDDGFDQVAVQGIVKYHF